MTRSQARFSFVLAGFVSALAACGDDKTGTPGDTTSSGDTFIPPDTVVATDTTKPPDTTVATDTTVAPDTTVATDATTPTDTTVAPDTTTDTSPDTAGGCGNNAIDQGELCDGSDLGDASCGSLGFDPAGTLHCNGSCTGYDTSGCQPSCGNGTLDDGELCDGAVIQDDTTCVDLGYSAGTLGCAANCLGVDVSTCTTTEVCGNNTTAGPEACDGSDLGVDPNGDPVTCESFGFAAGGALHCNGSCSNWDISACGDATVPGWTCPPAYFGDGECDCGCGIPDTDCGDGGVQACDFCNDAGSCATNPGCGDISAANTGVCNGTVVDCGNGEAGPGEMCDGEDLRDATCESLGFVGGTLGCTAHCSLDVSNCESPEVPAGWQCDAAYYGDGSCDCGCGAQDADCTSTTDVSECAFCDACGGTDTCDGFVSATDTTACSSAVPDGWTCSPSWFGDGDCDCGCGAKDSDCANTTDVAICDYCVDCQTAFEDCSTVVDAADTTACVQSDCGDGQVTGREDCDGTNLGGSSCTSLGFESGDLGCNDDCTFDLRLCVAPAVPDGWTCDATWYGDGDCDCGCGAQDFDCLGTSDVGECDFCIDCPGSGDCAARVDNADTTQCGGGVDGWTCDPTWFGDGDCDCGCGVQDRDCAGTTDVSECVACSPCSGPSPDCADRVDNADTTQCAASEVPLDWTCSASWYGDGSCDCGCGVQDLDCAGTTGIGECDYCIDCGAAVGDSCAGFVVPTDTTQCQPTDCGDRIVSGGEDCDGDNLGGATCLTLGFDGGTLGCNIDCSFDTIGCTRPVVPSGWACPDSYYGDADCDCGCGVQDIDCATDDDVRECDFCTNCPGAGDCSTKVDNSDTTLCSDVVVVPDGWTCNDAWYADGSCDCGCGIQDFDCAASDDVTECAFCSDCAGTGDCTARVDDADTTQCLNAVPTDWTCSPAFYGDGSCDCGCGVQDLDCADTTTVAACEYCEGCGVTAGDSCDGSVEPSDTTACVAGAVPSGWTCDDTWYGDGDCDCGCGVQDFDCSGTSDASECDYCIACPSNGSVDCADRVDGGDTTQCAVPGGWTCDPAWFGDGDCDCGCGAQDQDCGSTSDATECDFCTACGAAAGDSCGDFVDAGDTTLCAGTLPDGWSCSPSYYGDGDCDCGCGAQDSDCAATDDVTQCDFCDACPAGLSSACADIVDNGDTTLCADAAPDGWACDPAWYSDGDCDCGCGVQDADCATTDDATECAFCTVCGAASTDSCVDFVDARDTTQCFSACGNGVIDPGEQCEKTDLDGVTCTSLGFDGGELGCSDSCTFDTSLCVVPPLPADWTCVDTWFGDGDCDCGCGAPDVDCASTDDATECTYCIDCPGAGGDCIDRVDHADTTTCLPDGWRCDASFYDDTDCDCGCGAQDADCASTTSVAQCDFCDACGARPEDACADYILATDTTLCLVECGNGVVDGSEACDGSDLDGETCVTQGFAGGDLACDALCGFDTSGCLSDVPPFDWTCSTTWYGDGDCDCGCGAQDVDCAGTADANECDYCIACPGSGTCLDRVDSHDTTQCSATGAVPADWACPEAYFGDGTCDCGCGAQDSDCASTSDVTECLYCDACGVPFGDDCSTAVDAGDTTICQ